MLGASFLKLLKFLLGGAVISGFEIVILLIGMAVAFIVSLIIIDFLMSFVKRHTLSAFGVYRIILGALVIGYFIFN
jgi:undecaprenyl-diphosphatase